MKIKTVLPIVLLLSFVITGCDSATPPSSIAPSSEESSAEPSSAQPVTPTYLKKDVIVKVDPMAKETNASEPYRLTFKYDDELFTTDAKAYNKDLSMLSYGASIATANKERGTTFFYETGFEDITPHSYDVTPTVNTVGYFLAHKSLGEFELVTAAFRGFEYRMEWANNFQIGKTGNHEGFNARGSEAYQALQDYIATYAKDKPLKLWINGYSRAGAISNVLASYILKDNKVKVAKENMYVYTFEAPAALSTENAIAYENVHNITNQADIITFVPPEKYGLKRCGVDYDIYDADVATLMKAFDPEIEIPEFMPIEGTAENDIQMRDFILKSVFDVEESESATEGSYANTREQYVDNYQTGLSLGIGYIFALKPETRTTMLKDLQDLGFAAIGIIGDTTGQEMANFFKPYLEKDHISFEEETLVSVCAIMVKGIGTLFLTTLLLYLSEQKVDLTRLISMHYPEVAYVLLNNAHQKQAN